MGLIIDIRLALKRKTNLVSVMNKWDNINSIQKILSKNEKERYINFSVYLFHSVSQYTFLDVHNHKRSLLEGSDKLHRFCKEKTNIHRHLKEK